MLQHLSTSSVKRTQLPAVASLLPFLPTPAGKGRSRDLTTITHTHTDILHPALAARSPSSISPEQESSAVSSRLRMDALMKGFSMAKEGVVAAAEKTKAGMEEAAAKTKEGVMYVGNKTKEGVVSSVNTVANRTVDQANIVADTAVSGANEVSQAATEGVENIAASTGVLNQGEYGGMEQGGEGGEGY